MKLLQSLLILIFATIYTVQSKVQFVNFHPFTNSKCSGNSFGIGVSLVANDQCISISDNQSIKVSVDGLKVNLAQWVTQLDSFDCQGSTPDYKYTFANSSCVPMPSTFNFLPNQTVVSNFNTFYSQVSVTDYPMYPSQSQYQAFFSLDAGDDCNNDNFQYAVSYSQNIKLQQANSNSVNSYYCRNNTPYIRKCQGSQCSSNEITLYCDNAIFFSESIIACQN